MPSHPHLAHTNPESVYQAGEDKHLTEHGDGRGD